MLLRPAKPDDALAVARVHVRSWQVGYRDLMPADYLASMRPEDRAARYTFGHADPDKPSTIVAVEDDAIAGFVTTGRDGELGHLMALYVDPDRWGRGVGRTLIEAGRGVLAGRGFGEAVLWMLAGNVRADRFYVHDGWRFDGTVERKQLWGIEITDHRYRRALP
jgi:GNAT superfamily N-acetyltransferase